MKYDPSRPILVQNDFTLLVECRHPQFELVRSKLALFADLVKSPEFIHTYRITPLSLWNAATMYLEEQRIIRFLEDYSKNELPQRLRTYIMQYMQRYGLLRLTVDGNRMLLVSEDERLMKQIMEISSLQPCLKAPVDSHTAEVVPSSREQLKRQLLHLGYPVHDAAGYHQGEALSIELRNVSEKGTAFGLRRYQQEAVDQFCRYGSGVVVLPCGAGKTIVGIAVMSKLQCATLILTTNATSANQWKREILDKTNAREETIGEYNGLHKEVKPITIATYQILTHRRNHSGEFTHMRLFNERDWGLIIYDEVHLLPAPVFRMTAGIQGTRRLGLTATLVREDGREDDVFSLIGPKRYEISWKELESQGWIAEAQCVEVRVPLPPRLLNSYRSAGARQRYRLAGENPLKLDIIHWLLQKHQGRQVLIIGHYLQQLKTIAKRFGAPIISGELPMEERKTLYEQFRQGRIPLLVVSKVANFAVDLPDASVAIQVSGSFGSRQEEAQRLGRILRAKKDGNGAFFYSLVSEMTKEQDYALNRQRFLVEQGYRYRIENIPFPYPKAAEIREERR